jgi:DNA-directed RNA polymerase subunit RPC12/RpoP
LKVQNYKCRACGAPLRFDGEEQKLVCDYCGTSYDISEYESPEEKSQPAGETAESRSGQWEENTGNEGWAEEYGMHAYICPSCGAELICDRETVATSCPYCGNPAVIPGKFSEDCRRPDFVLPFRLSKEQAAAQLKKHYRGKKLLPKNFSDANHIQEIKGIYVPFWLFDGKSRGDAHFACSNSSSSRRGDYIVTTTRHYDVYRSGEMNFSGLPVDGSSKMPDDYMDSIEPYDYRDLKSFSGAYLPGFLADKYDVSSSDAAERAEVRFRKSFTDAMNRTVRGYETVLPAGGHYDLVPGRISYALMPVWLLNTKWKDKTYLFAVNGQTGKMAGDLPIDGKKQNIWFFGLLAGITALLSLLFTGPLSSFLQGLFG